MAMLLYQKVFNTIWKKH